MSSLRQVCVVAAAGRFAVVLALGALGLCWSSTPKAHAQSGWVLQYTGLLAPLGVRTPQVPICHGRTYCQFWEELDRNAATARIVVVGDQVYQLHSGGAIFQYPSTPCTTHCPGWWEIDRDPTTRAIFSDGTSLYKLIADGALWRWTGSGWTMVPYNPAGKYTPDGYRGGHIVTVAFGGGTTALVQGNKLTLRAKEVNVEYGHTSPRPVAVTGTGVVYELHPGYSFKSCNWCSWEVIPGFLVARTLMDPPYQQFFQTTIEHPQSIMVAIAAGSDSLFTLQVDGSIWRYMATPWNGAQPHRWEKLDNNPATARIVSSGSELYQLHTNGTLWRYTGRPCNVSGDHCPGWEMLLAGGVGRIAVDGQRVYALTQTPTSLVRPGLLGPVYYWHNRPGTPISSVCPECL